MANNSVRVRFAPSPTGPLHMGGVRTALFNYLFAKKHNGTFVIRIEDTDQSRFVPEAQNYILESLAWCGILPTEGPGIGGDYGPYVQSERRDLYRPYADQLVAEGKAYLAFDTKEELDAMRSQAETMGMDNWQYNATTRTTMRNSLTLSADEVEERIRRGDNYTIRMKMPRNTDVRFEDAIRGWVVVNSTHLDDKVLFKSDGMPTYHLANIIDDHLMAITHVIRGEEWLPSAPLHLLLYDAFGWERPTFAHLPLILKPNGKGKLSKRDGEMGGFPVFPLDWKADEGKTYMGYREQGYYPEAFINMLAFLGWNPGTTQEIFSLDELCNSFSLDRVSKSGAKFDPDKTKWFQQHYLRSRDDQAIAEELSQILTEKYDIDYLKTVSKLIKERATFASDILIEGSYLFERPETYDDKTTRKKWKEHSSSVLEAWVKIMETIEPFHSDQIETSFKTFITERELGIGALLPLFRLLITGKGAGPSMFEIAAFLGKEECVSRMHIGLEYMARTQQA